MVKFTTSPITSDFGYLKLPEHPPAGWNDIRTLLMPTGWFWFTLPLLYLNGFVKE